MKIMQENTLNDTNQNTNYTVTLEGDDEDCFLPLPDELLDNLGWYENDILEWIVNDDNTITIRKVVEWTSHYTKSTTFSLHYKKCLIMTSLEHEKSSPQV